MQQASFEQAFSEVKKLVADFRSSSGYYLSAAYQEQEARHDFIDKLFIALGWDVYHEFQKNPYAQEVKIELGLQVGEGRKRADYAFYIAPNYRDVRFYAEAKKPVGCIATEANYFQTIRYGWNSQTPLAVLTDFEEFHVLDCRYTPDRATALSRAVKTFHYSDYEQEEKFREMYYLFSRETVADNSIEKFAETLPKKRGRSAAQLSLFPGGYKTIDEMFLDELDEFRIQLAKNFKNNNPDLNGWELTEITQRTIDRLVFMRFLEDKLIESEALLAKFGERDNVWRDFSAASRRLDRTYNGTIFKKHTILDDHEFSVNDDQFADVCERLSNINSPYDFNTVPIHILGSIYERFLGKVITVTDKRARVEEKPEVKKAGGVYYTPEYIVRYIVENTVGKLIDGKTPDQIATMRFADIACGSGSFLLGAYDCLLRYHTAFYNEQPYAAREGDCVKRSGALYLTVHKKKEILLNNIYGVDIDHQAVEVAQLSLYLKLLEDETTGAADTASREKLLPLLNKNIQCGNSLVEPDYYEGVQETLALYEDEERERKINVFDWKAAFPEVMRNGGFDAVIGNPPYVRQEMLGEYKPYFERKYSVYHGMADLYTYFFERGVSLLNENGLFSIIVANKWMRANYGEPLRKWLKGKTVHEVIDFGDLPVFQKATTYPCVITISRGAGKKAVSACKVETLDFQDLNSYRKKNSFKVHLSSLKDDGWSLTDEKSELLLDKIRSKGVPLGEYVRGKIFYGIKTGFNEAFVIDEETRKRLIREDKKSVELIKPLLAGRDIKRYCSEESGKYIIVIPKGWTKQNMKGVNAWAWFKKEFRSIAQHLSPFEDSAKKRCDQGEFWWELRACDYYSEFDKVKIMLPDIALRGNFVYDEDKNYCLNTCYIISSDDKILLGILNSKVITFFYSHLSSTYRGGYLRFIFQYIEQLPICIKDIDQPRRSEITSLVTTLLSLHRSLPTARTDSDRERITQRIASADRRIDELVYELYGLTGEEIKIVEGGKSGG